MNMACLVTAEKTKDCHCGRHHPQAQGLDAHLLESAETEQTHFGPCSNGYTTAESQHVTGILLSMPFFRLTGGVHCATTMHRRDWNSSYAHTLVRRQCSKLDKRIHWIHPSAAVQQAARWSDGTFTGTRSV